MEHVMNIDWAGMFLPDKPMLEIFIRGSVTYLMLFAFMRLIKRQAGAMGISDLLVVVLIADASQNAMASDYSSLSDGILLVATIIFWNYMLEFLAFHFSFFDAIVHPNEMPLIKNGRIIRANLRAEFITVDELKSQLRLQGVDAIADVKSACLEGDGKISVITYDNADRPKARDTAVS